MPAQPCPHCRQPDSKLLHAALTDDNAALLSYYQCQHCQHVWSIDARRPDVVIHVTPLPAPPSAKAS